MPTHRTSVFDRFKSFPKERLPNGCLNWSGSISRGYGELIVGGKYGKKVRAHRIAYEVAFGAIPLGLCVLHRCDNPRCVNPDHLFLGTQADNLQDMRSKGRQVYVSKPMKLDQAKVADIRKRALTGEKTADIAALHGISKAMVWKIVNRKCWRDTCSLDQISAQSDPPVITVT